VIVPQKRSKSECFGRRIVMNDPESEKDKNVERNRATPDQSFSLCRREIPQRHGPNVAVRTPARARCQNRI